MNDLTKSLKKSKSKSKLRFVTKISISEKVHKVNNVDDEFNPHDYGNTENPINFFGAVVHIIKYTIGYGMLVVPLVFKNLGYAIATVLTLFVALVYYHIIHILVDIEYQLCKLTKRPKLTFLEVIYVGFEHVALPLRVTFGSFVKLLMHFHYGIPMGNAIGLILMSNITRNMFEHLDVEISFMQAMNIVFVPTMLLSVFVRKLSFMVPFSALTNIFTLAIMGLVFAFSLLSGGPKSTARPINDITLLPQCFALLMDAFKATAVFITIKNEMRTPKQFSAVCGVLNVAGSILFFLFACFGAISYWNYGDEIRANVLSNLPENNIFSFAINALFIPVLIVHHYLVVYVRCDMYRGSVLKVVGGEKKGRKVLVEYGLRLFFNISAYLFAAFIPSFGIFATISGTMSILTDIAIAPLLQFCLIVTFWSEFKFGILMKAVKNAAIVCIAFILFFGSARACFKALVKLFNNN